MADLWPHEIGPAGPRSRVIEDHWLLGAMYPDIVESVHTRLKLITGGEKRAYSQGVYVLAIRIFGALPRSKMVELILRGLFDPARALGPLESSRASPGSVLRPVLPGPKRLANPVVNHSDRLRETCCGFFVQDARPP